MSFRCHCSEINSNCCLFHVLFLLDDPRYEVVFRMSGPHGQLLGFRCPVFSIETDLARLRGRYDVLELSENVILRMRKTDGIRKAWKSEGVTHRLDVCAVLVLKN